MSEQDPMKFNLKITTSIDEEHGLILQECQQWENRISFEVMNIKNSQVREALIKLGWTPPNEQPPQIPPASLDRAIQ